MKMYGLLRSLNMIRNRAIQRERSRRPSLDISAEDLLDAYKEIGYTDTIEGVVSRLSTLLRELRTAEPETTAHLVSKQYLEDAKAHRTTFNITLGRFVVCAENPEDSNYKRAHLYLPIGGRKSHGIRIVFAEDDFLFFAWECYTARGTGAKFGKQLSRDIQAGKQGHLPSLGVNHTVGNLLASIPDGINGVDKNAKGLSAGLRGYLLEAKDDVHGIIRAMQADPFGENKRRRNIKRKPKPNNGQ
jgi:hypothetical protein